MLTSTGGGLSAQTISLMRDSRRHQVRVIAVNAGEAPAAKALADDFFVVPRGDDPGYVGSIVKIAEQRNVDLVLPCSDEEALALSGERERIEVGGRQLACADAAMLQTFSDKQQSFAFLAARGIRVPHSVSCTTMTEVDEALRQFDCPFGFVIKPQHSRGNRGIFVVRDDLTGLRLSHSGREKHMDRQTFIKHHKGELAAYLPVLVSERLIEPAFDIDVLADRGRALRVVPRMRANPEGMPFLGNTIVPDLSLIRLGEQVAQAAGLSWLYDFDIMSDRANQPVVIECNPRPSGSVAAAVAAGVPLFDDLISLAKGEALPALPALRRSVITPYFSLAVSQ